MLGVGVGEGDSGSLCEWISGSNHYDAYIIKKMCTFLLRDTERSRRG